MYIRTHIHGSSDGYKRLRITLIALIDISSRVCIASGTEWFVIGAETLFGNKSTSKVK